MKYLGFLTVLMTACVFGQVKPNTREGGTAQTPAPIVAERQVTVLDDGDLRTMVLLWDGKNEARLLVSRVSAEDGETQLAAEIVYTRGKAEPQIVRFIPGVLGSSIAPHLPSGNDETPQSVMSCTSTKTDATHLWIVCVCWQGANNQMPIVCVNEIVVMPS